MEMELMEKFLQYISGLSDKELKRLQLYMKNPYMASQNFNFKKSDMNGLKKKMDRKGRDSYSWLEILQMDFPSFEKIAKK